MKIESKDRKIKNLFLNRRYLIPDYQRKYSWDVNEEVLIFWDDFIYRWSAKINYLFDSNECFSFII